MKANRTFLPLLTVLVIVGCAKREPAPQAVSTEAPAPTQPAPAEPALQAAPDREEEATDTDDRKAREALPPQPASPSIRPAQKPGARPSSVAPPAAGAVEVTAPKKRGEGLEAISSLRDANEQIERSWASFTESLDTSHSDCAEAGEHQRAICDIAARICSLVDQGAFRADTSGDPRQVCDSAKAKCNSARDHLGNRCP